MLYVNERIFGMPAVVILCGTTRAPQLYEKDHLTQDLRRHTGEFIITFITLVMRNQACH